MTPDEQRFLAAARIAHLATADADGRPHVVPVCFALVPDRSDETNGEAVRSTAAPVVVTPVDEKPKSVGPESLRRVRDVRENTRVSLVVDRYVEEWDELGWVQVRGTAAVLEPGEPGHDRAVTALRGKYDQYADHALAARPAIAVTVGRAVSWGAIDVRD